MQFFTILSALAAASTVTAWSVELSQADGGVVSDACNILQNEDSLTGRDLQKRCDYNGCDDCYERLPVCRVCNEAGGDLASCLVW